MDLWVVKVQEHMTRCGKLGVELHVPDQAQEEEVILNIRVTGIKDDLGHSVTNPKIISPFRSWRSSRECHLVS